MSVGLPLMGCEMDGSDNPALRQAFEELLDALDAGDGNRLWELTDARTKEYFVDLARRLSSAAEVVKLCYPPQYRAKAFQNVLGHYISTGNSGKRLFLALLDPRRLEAPHAADARTIARIDTDGDRAAIVTVSGRRITFVKEDGQYKTTRLLEVFKTMPWVDTLERNLATVQANCRIAWRPMSPENRR